MKVRFIHPSGDIGYGTASSPSAPTLFNRRGTELTACPTIALVLFEKRLSAGPELLWERRFGGKSVDHSVWYGRNALEPGLRAEWRGGIIDASGRAAYRSEQFSREYKILQDKGDGGKLVT